MKIAIIGAGFTGLAAALHLTQAKHQVTLFEATPKVGGLATGFTQPGWNWPLEIHYHHIFTSDHHAKHLAQTTHTPCFFARPTTASLYQNRIYPFDSPLALLKFPHLTFAEKFRTAATLAALKTNPFWPPLEHITTENLLSAAMGSSAYHKLWAPLMTAKFGVHAPEIAASWFWARIKKRSAKLGYFEGGFQTLAQNTANLIRKNQGQIHLATPVNRITPASPHRLRLIFSPPKTKTQTAVFDACLVTLPSPPFLKITPSLPSNYRHRLSRLTGIGSLTLLLQLKTNFFPQNTYWLNILDKNFPFLAVVEHTNFIDASHYANQHLVYIGNYLPPTHSFFKKSRTELLKVYHPYLTRLSPHYQKHLVNFHLFKSPFTQPLITRNYSRLLPPLATPIKNLYLANLQQVYPWDRGTNYAIELGQKAAHLIANNQK